MQGLIDFQVTRWFSEKFPASHPMRVKQAKDVFLANDFECYASTCALLGDADLRHYLPSFKMPVAVIVGEEDYATPIAMGEALHQAIAQSSFRIIKGGRHLTPIECPDEIAGEIATLMGRI
jgi:3-oxoadipate enol-lactonase